MENENIKEKIITSIEKIQELLDEISEIKKTNNDKNMLNRIKIIEKKCYAIISKKCFLKWYKRLRQKNIKSYKILKKGIIFKVK